MDDEDDGARGRSKLYVSVDFLYHLLYAGLDNVARTPVIFKAGIFLLNLAFVFYITGFVSPYWVMGDIHSYKHDPWGNRLPEDVPADSGGNVSSWESHNDTHFGLWEECVVVEGQSICTIFSEDVDSVIVMFGCVGGVILFGLCCWALLACVRRPQRGRYYLIVISAVIGGVFGVVSLVIFMLVQRKGNYSWAFALFLIACLLEWSAAAVFLWGIRWASERELFPLTVEETQDTTTLPPSIIVTGATPARKGQPRPVHVIHKSPRTRRVSRGRKEEDHVDFITLGMVSAVPGQARGPESANRKKKKKKKGRRRGKRETDESPAAVESLARQVVEHHTSFVHLGSPPLPPASPPPPPPPRPPADTKPSVSSSGEDASQPLIPTTPPGDRPPSVYIDLTGVGRKVPSSHGHGQCPFQYSEPVGQSGNPQEADFRWTHDEDAGGQVAGCPIRLLAEVHQSDDPDDYPALTLHDRAEPPEPECFLRGRSSVTQPCHGEARGGLAPHRPQASPVLRQARTSECGTEPSPSAESRGLKIPDTVSLGSGGSSRGARKPVEPDYVKYSPDSYYQHRDGANCSPDTCREPRGGANYSLRTYHEPRSGLKNNPDTNDQLTSGVRRGSDSSHQPRGGGKNNTDTYYMC